MRTYILAVSIFLLWVMSPLYMLAANNNMDGSDKQQQPQTEEFSFKASSRVDIQAEGFSLSAEKGSLKHAMKISVTTLPYKNSLKMP